MSTARYPLTFPPEEASSWRRIRKYAVPRWMIEQATERRLAGDWRGACATANVDVGFDLAEARQYGDLVADMVEDDLTHFAPDLARWHLPRFLRGRTTLQTRQMVLLAGYGNREADGPYLYLTTPDRFDGPQRLRLRFGFPASPHRVHYWGTSRHLWDARRTADLRERCGAADPVSDRITALHDDGQTAQACEAAGIVLDGTLLRTSSHGSVLPVPILSRYPLALTRLEPEIRLLAAAGFGDRFQIVHTPHTRIVFELHRRRLRKELRIRRVAAGKDTAAMAPPLPEACWRRLPDLDLLRFGELTPGQLHPLINASLFPDRGAMSDDGPPGPEAPALVRVRCRGEWHHVGNHAGHFQIPHGDDEQRCERALGALGGPTATCVEVEKSWTSGTGWLPKKLREQRRELFTRVQQGDTPGVLELLDLGMDPRVRDGRQRSLLHLLPMLDYEVLMPRLLDADLDLEARDQHRYTPLYTAACEGGSADLVRALLDAGAVADVTDEAGRSLVTVIRQLRREDLNFLAEQIIAGRER